MNITNEVAKLEKEIQYEALRNISLKEELEKYSRLLLFYQKQLNNTQKDEERLKNFKKIISENENHFRKFQVWCHKRNERINLLTDILNRQEQINRERSRAIESKTEEYVAKFQLELEKRFNENEKLQSLEAAKTLLQDLLKTEEDRLEMELEAKEVALINEMEKLQTKILRIEKDQREGVWEIRKKTIQQKINALLGQRSRPRAPPAVTVSLQRTPPSGGRQELSTESSKRKPFSLHFLPLLNEEASSKTVETAACPVTSGHYAPVPSTPSQKQINKAFKAPLPLLPATRPPITSRTTIQASSGATGKSAGLLSATKRPVVWKPGLKAANPRPEAAVSRDFSALRSGDCVQEADSVMETAPKPKRKLLGTAYKRLGPQSL